MQNHGSIVISTVRNLEVEDTFSMGDFGGGILTGKIQHLVHFVFDLTEDERSYLKAQNIDVSMDKDALAAGQDSVLIFGTFVSVLPGNIEPHTFKHIYLPYNHMIVVFPKS